MRSRAIHISEIAAITALMFGLQMNNNSTAARQISTRTEPSFIAAEVDEQLVVRQWTNNIFDSRSDLLLGDVILSWNGTRLESNDQLAQLWQAGKRGDQSRVLLNRGGKEVDILFTHRGVSDYFRVALSGGRSKFADPDQMYSEWNSVPLPLRDAACNMPGAPIQDELRSLQRAFRKTTDELRDHFMSDHVAFLLNHPFHAEHWAEQQITRLSEAGTGEELVAELWRLADPESRSWQAAHNPIPAASDFDGWVVHLEQRALEIDQAYAAAFSNFSPAELTELRQWSLSFRPLRKDKAEWSEILLGLNDAKRVDFKKLQRAQALSASLLSDLVPGGAIHEGLKTTAEQRDPRRTYESTNVLGPEADSISTLSKPILIDLGGNDQYDFSIPENVRFRTRILIDFSGDDVYLDRESSLGSAACSCVLFIDGAGDDQYSGTDRSLGCAVLGCGILWDESGTDSYHSQRNSQGFACCGVGLLVDKAGSDRYESGVFSQGVGIAGGCGAIVDYQGNEVYRCTGLEPSNYGDAGEFAGMGQGIGWGIRWGCAGGVGVLLDLAGDDQYSAGQFGLGCGYCYGIGILADRAGQDRYECSRYGLGTAAHFGVGIALDHQGNDRYFANRNAAVAELGSSWDLSIGLFVDSMGDDEYHAVNYALGGAAQNAYGFFWDKAGRDSYESAGLQAGEAAGYAGQATYGSGRQAKNLSIFLDEGGQDDSYRIPGRSNNQSGVQNEFGVWIDR